MNYKKLCLILFLFFGAVLNAQTLVETVTDFDGNLYHAIQIGNQIWLQENMNCVHYSNGDIITGVAAYNDNAANAAIYGRLYTWDAAMKNSRLPKAQGIAPDGYHIPSDEEWTELENYLGGATIAGAKMKSSGTTYWNSPNSATNSSGFSVLPGGEYDAYYQPNVYRLIKEYAVYWTSTEVSTLRARERFLKFDSDKSDIYDWYKVMKYSIRCIKNTRPVGTEKEKSLPKSCRLYQNYPNPFNPVTIIKYSVAETPYMASLQNVTLKVYDSLGREVQKLVDELKPAGNYSVHFDAANLPTGVYFYVMRSGSSISAKKMILNK